MARPSTKGLELTFHGPTRSWSKMIDGKRVKFGKGRGWSDRTSYRQALGSYRTYVDEHSAERKRLKRFQKLQAEFVATGRDPNYAGWALSIEESREAVERKRQQAVIEEAAKLQGKMNVARGSDKPTIDELLTDYLREQERRYEITRKHPESLPRKRRLGLSGLQSIRDVVEVLRRWIADHSDLQALGDVQQTEEMLADYRRYLEDQMLAGDLQPQTVSNRVRGLRPLVKWLWQNRHVEDLPRNLDEVCQQFGYKQQAKALTKEQIDKLWATANDRWKALIALGLNAGLYARELASIRVRHIQQGYLAKRREKTGVPYRIKLWPIPQQLIQAQANGQKPDDLLFTSKRGKPLCRDAAKSRSDGVANAFAKLRDKAGLNDVTWSMLRDTAATELEKIGKRTGNPALVSQLLAHADGRTARFYVDVSGDPMDLVTDALDKAVDELERVFALKWQKQEQE